ncbi:Embryonic polyadenylate-binding protein 2 [Heterocephalus glaber]|uniref:Embryonic polyadenylate-binding protein 2 n=1 Tax=Heterocephalus glaber TaxID=10181 RepID=G5C2T5_HETGA|nr:Embryonic polyadenylate-binding protein 2 [Heterocephalus glaber]
MWPFQSCTLFPPPTEAWLQTVSSDPEAQGWGAWARSEKTPLEPGSGGGREAEEEEDGDAGFPLSLLESDSLANGPEPDQVLQDVPRLTLPCWQGLEAIKLKLWTMEQAQGAPEPPSKQELATEEEGARARQLLSPETVGGPFPVAPRETVEADHRSIYVGNSECYCTGSWAPSPLCAENTGAVPGQVDYGGTAEELQAHFHPCGEVHRVTILCDKFSGHPKGYAYVEFTTQLSAQAAVELDESIFRGRVIKVLPKRTNFPGISSTDRGGLQGTRVVAAPCSSLQGRPRFRPRGQGRGRGRFSMWFSPY